VRRLESSRAAADAAAEAASQALREAHQQRSVAAAAAAEAGGDSATAAVAAAMLRQQLARAQEERAELSRQVDQLQVRPEVLQQLQHQAADGILQESNAVVEHDDAVMQNHTWVPDSATCYRSTVSYV
jgi:hypothetical protein